MGFQTLKVLTCLRKTCHPVFQLLIHSMMLENTYDRVINKAVIVITRFTPVKIPERSIGQQRTPDPVPEEEGDRAGGGEEVSVTDGTRRSSCRGQEAAEKAGSSSERAEGHQAVQH